MRKDLRPRTWAAPKPTERASRLVGPGKLPPLRVIDLPGAAPEDVVVDEQGRALAGLEDGRIVRIDLGEDPSAATRVASGGTATVETLANTGGRPLGLEFLPDGSLLICDAQLGLLRLDLDSGAIGTLVGEIDGKPILICNNAAVARDGTIFFTDSSTRFRLEHYKGDLLEHSRTGRLLRRDPDGSVETLLDGLAFANGVALAPDESCVFVAETGTYRIQRLWLDGPRAGVAEMFVENLPGIPDNLSTGTDGLVWVALPAPRHKLLDAMLRHDRFGLVRRATWQLPQRLLPDAGRTMWVQAYDVEGGLVHDLQDRGERIHEVTGMREHHGFVWMGSLVDACVAVLGPLDTEPLDTEQPRTVD